MRYVPLALAFLLTACTGERTFDVRGQVVGFGDNDSTLIVSHEAVPGFMPAMTMPFNADAALPELDHNDRVRFVLHVTREASWITDIQRLPDTTTLALADAPSRLPPSSDRPDLVLHKGDAVPPAMLLGDDGIPLSLTDYNGQVLVLNFIYTRCPLPDYCPLLSRRFAQLHDRYGSDEGVQLLSVTIDPDYDTPEVLGRYRSQYTDTPQGWRFATGTQAQVDSVYALFGQFVLGAEAELQHNLVTAVVGRDGRVREYFRGQGWTVDEVIEAVEQAR